MPCAFNSKNRLYRIGLHKAACEASGFDQQAGRARDALGLIGSGDLTYRSAPFPLCAKRAVETVIAAGAFESAALAMLPPGSAWMLSRSGAGECLASVLIHGLAEEVTAHGATPALALLAAHAAAVIAVASPVRDQTALLSQAERARLH